MALEKLFTENYLDAFQEGDAVQLVLRRNRNLGFLFTAERGIFYIQILYRLLCFRREHELEPLNEEIYREVRGAQPVAEPVQIAGMTLPPQTGR